MHIRKERYLLILFAGIVLAMALHIDMVLSILQWIFDLIIPLGVGLLLAFVLNTPISGLYRFITKHFFSPKDEKQKKMLNMFCLVVVLAFIAFLIAIAVIMFIDRKTSGISGPPEPVWHRCFISRKGIIQY